MTVWFEQLVDVFRLVVDDAAWITGQVCIDPLHNSFEGAKLAYLQIRTPQDGAKMGSIFSYQMGSITYKKS